jgi:hypothetical protein
MVKYSSEWTSSVSLTPDTKIFCVEIKNMKLIKDIRVESELEPLGIVLDFQHIVTGKGLNPEQTSALLQLATQRTLDGLVDLHNVVSDT